MAYKIPEQFRLTKKKAKGFSFIGAEIVDMVSDETQKEDGFFFIPPMGKKEGGRFLCRSTVVEGWHMVGVNIPAEGRTPTWEEMDYVRRFFFEEDTPVFSFYPPKGHTYIVDRWLHLWQPVDETTSKMIIPPLLQPHYLFRRAPFFTRLYRAIIKNLNYDRAGTKGTSEKTTNTRVPSDNNGGW